MAEGGLFPWKLQKPDGMVYCSYEEIFKPLPPPPEGKIWKKCHVEEADGAMTKWELVDVEVVVKEKENAGEVTQDEDEEVRRRAMEQLGYVEHTVLPTDTMAGLQIRYKITAAELRKHNDFFSDRFQLCHTLKIPIKGREEVVVKNGQRLTKDVIRQRFRNLTGCKDEEEISYYLDFHGNNINEAVLAYQGDMKWEADHYAKRVVAKAVAPPAPSPPRPYQPATVVHRQAPPPSYGAVMESKAKRRAKVPYDFSPIRMKNFVSASPPRSPTCSYRTLEDDEVQYSSRRGGERAPLLGQAVRFV